MVMVPLQKGVETISPINKKLINVAKQRAFEAGLKFPDKPGASGRYKGYAIGQVIKKNNFIHHRNIAVMALVTMFMKIRMFIMIAEGSGPLLRDGMVICIGSMIAKKR